MDDTPANTSEFDYNIFECVGRSLIEEYSSITQPHYPSTKPQTSGIDQSNENDNIDNDTSTAPPVLAAEDTNKEVSSENWVWVMLSTPETAKTVQDYYSDSPVRFFREMNQALDFMAIEAPLPSPANSSYTNSTDESISSERDDSTSSAQNTIESMMTLSIPDDPFSVSDEKKHGMIPTIQSCCSETNLPSSLQKTKDEDEKRKRLALGSTEASERGTEAPAPTVKMTLDSSACGEAMESIQGKEVSTGSGGAMINADTDCLFFGTKEQEIDSLASLPDQHVTEIELDGQAAPIHSPPRRRTRKKQSARVRKTKDSSGFFSISSVFVSRQLYSR